MDYFFHGIYDKSEISDKLIKIGFTKETYHIQGFPSLRFISGYKDFIVELTSPKEGKLQIQGEGPKDISNNGENSKYYYFYQKIIETIDPDKITNSKSEILYER